MDHSNFMEMVSLIEFMYEQFIQDFLFDFRLVQAYITGGVKKGAVGTVYPGPGLVFGARSQAAYVFW